MDARDRAALRLGKEGMAKDNKITLYDLQRRTCPTTSSFAWGFGVFVHRDHFQGRHQ